MRRVDPRTRKSTIIFRSKAIEYNAPIQVINRHIINNVAPFTGEAFGLKTLTNKKINLKDCTFIIPVSYDSIHRKQNLEMCLNYLNKNFDTNIIVGEQGSDEFEYVNKSALYLKFDYKQFHRTRMLNQMTKLAGTTIVFNWDADVFIAPMQIWKAAEMLRSGQSDFVYPYDGAFARVPREFASVMNKKLDVGIFAGREFSGMEKGARESVGGAIAYNKDRFFEAGGENEAFVSYSPEDSERRIRFERLGYSVKRVAGSLYHMDHWTGVNSSPQNPHFQKGNEEFAKVIKMDKGTLLKYVQSWNR